MPTHKFTVVLTGYDQLTDDIEQRVIAAGCDDGFLFARGGVVYLELERAAVSLRDAFEQAVSALAHAGLADLGAKRRAQRSVIASSVKNIELPRAARVRSGTVESISP